MIRAERAQGILALATFVAIPLLAIAGCEDASAPVPATIPTFVYVADSAGYPGLVRFRNDSAVALTTGSKNTEPRSAAGRLVFTSERDGYPQVYISDLDVTTPHRVMTTFSFDRTPALSPSADSIVFVSTRTGVPRLYLIRAPALNQSTEDSARALATGSAAYTPEDGPAWSPLGGKIAFTSVSGGNSQVYVVPSGGGAAAVLTNESGGAFQPTWSGDGSSIYYIAATPGYSLRVVSAAGGPSRTVVADSFFVAGPATCNGSFCLYGTGFGLPRGSMSAIALQSEEIQVLFPRTAANERQPAILIP
jgi:hypothetical protein